MSVLERCDDVGLHHEIKTGVVVLEYASEGRVVSTGAPYTNRYISVLTITRSQGHSLARLPRPRGGLRRARMAVTLMDGASVLETLTTPAHFTAVQAGWEEVAGYALQWALYPVPELTAKNATPLQRITESRPI